MSGKHHVQEYGETAATTLHLIQPYHGSGRCIIADSWFGSGKSASKLKRWGLYSIVLAETVHKDFLCQLLGEESGRLTLQIKME